MAIRRGEIYWVEFDPVKGNAQGEVLPALVVQNDVGNRYGRTTVVAAITRNVPPKPYPFVVVVEPEESGLPARSAINCAQIATIQQTGPESRLRAAPDETEVRAIGQLSDEVMRKVSEALAFNLDFDKVAT